MLEKNNNNNFDINLIVNLLHKKSKRDFKYYHRKLVEQANYFSPEYRDFIYKVIKNNSIRIRTSGQSFIVSDFSSEDDPTYSRRAKNRIYLSMDELRSLPHELGHAVDFWFSHSKSFSTSVVLSNGRTLEDIFEEEFAEKHKEVYEIVMKEYEHIINSTINDQAFTLLIDNMDEYRTLLSIPYDKKNKKACLMRRKIQQHLYEIGFVETYYQFVMKNCPFMLNQKYETILDALSSEYDFMGLNLYHHNFVYYQRNKSNRVYEFFANCFASKMENNKRPLDFVKHYFPKSYEAFEELFNIFYTHIQNNKRFKDVTIRKESC